MGKIITRCLDPQLPAGKSAFLWGPRQVGKTHWIVHSFLKDDHHLIDLLKTDVYAEYASRPALLRERWAGKLTVIDEIQKIPALLDEIHWLIENRSASFLLTGSSARKLRKTHANLLAGRARRLEMGPLTFFETEGFELEKVLSTGLLPPHFLSPTPLGGFAGLRFRLSPRGGGGGIHRQKYPRLFGIFESGRHDQLGAFKLHQHRPANPGSAPRWRATTSRFWKTPCSANVSPLGSPLKSEEC